MSDGGEDTIPVFGEFDGKRWFGFESVFKNGGGWIFHFLDGESSGEGVFAGEVRDSFPCVSEFWVGFEEGFEEEIEPEILESGSVVFPVLVDFSFPPRNKETLFFGDDEPDGGSVFDVHGHSAGAVVHPELCGSDCVVDPIVERLET